MRIKAYGSMPGNQAVMDFLAKPCPHGEEACAGVVATVGGTHCLRDCKNFDKWEFFDIVCKKEEPVPEAVIEHFTEGKGK